MKKQITFLFCLSFLLLSISVFGQKKGSSDKITAIKLSAKVAQQYLGKVTINAFTINNDYVLRPNKGYEIVYDSESKKVTIKPEGVAVSSNGNFQIEKVPGGTMFCLCSQSSDDCRLKPTIADSTLNYFCDGSCNCGSFIIYDVSMVRQFETIDGSWNYF